MKRARLLATPKALAKKKAASRYDRIMVPGSSSVNEDAVDARLIREAREADKGKARLTVNELRAQRGLAAI